MWDGRQSTLSLDNVYIQLHFIISMYGVVDTTYVVYLITLIDGGETLIKIENDKIVQ